MPESGDFSGVRWWGIALYPVTLVGMWWFRSVRWRFLLRSIVDEPRLRLFAVSSAGFAAILLSAFRIGELARPYMLRTPPEEIQPGKPVLTMTAATTSIVAERVIDGLFISLVLAIVLLTVPTIQPLPAMVVGLPISVATVRASAFILLGAFAAAFAVLAVFYFARGFAHRATHAIVGRVSPALAAKLTGLFEKLVDGLHVLRSWRDALGFLVETAIYWCFNALGMWLLAIACGIVHADGSHITFLEAVGLMGMLSCAILVPGPPGLIGVFQAGIYAGMTMYFPTHVVSGPGAAYVFLVYVLQVVWTFVLGGWGVWHEGGARRLRGVTQQREAKSAARGASRRFRGRRALTRYARALTWVAGASAVLGVLDLISTLVCIRLWVSTAEFGAATLAIALFPILVRLGGMGLGAALVRDPDADSEATVFWLNVGAAAAVLAALVAARPLVARAFGGQAIVASLLAAYGARLAVQSAAVVPEARMRRALRFGELAAIRVAAGPPRPRPNSASRTSARTASPRCASGASRWARSRTRPSRASPCSCASRGGHACDSRARRRRAQRGFGARCRAASCSTSRTRAPTTSSSAPASATRRSARTGSRTSS